MNTKPKISVLIPAWNCEEYVAAAIDSIFSQTVENWELLIADDGSTDNTRRIVDEYDDPRVRRFHSDAQLGVVHTRNRLLQHAQADVVTWLDADDISYNFRLEKLLHAFEENDELALCGSNVAHHLKYSGEYIETNFPLTHEAIRDSITQHKRIPFKGPSVAFRRNILNDISEFRPFFNFGGGDPDFILRVSEKYCVGNIPDVLYAVRYTRNSVSRQFDQNSYLRLYLRQIWFFLAEQRAHNSGIDGLMEGGDREEFEAFLKQLQQDFDKDRSAVYRQASLNKISNQDYIFAAADALNAVMTNPLIIQNYSLFVRLVASSIKSSGRALRRILR